MSVIRIAHTLPYDWDAMLAHLAARAIDGVEKVVDGGYERGRLRVTKEVDALSVRGASDVERVRRVFDVHADVSTIGAHLARDPMLRPLVRARPGLRVPGGYDGFELAVRAVLGQQVTLEAGRKLASRLVAIVGHFPSAEELLRADLTMLGMPRSRKETLRAVAAAFVEDPSVFDSRGDVDRTVARLRQVRGVGDWTAHYIALRAAREPDAFPVTDVVLLRRAGMTPLELARRAERWRPWRGYAAQHLWTSP